MWRAHHGPGRDSDDSTQRRILFCSWKHGGWAGIYWDHRGPSFQRGKNQRKNHRIIEESWKNQESTENFNLEFLSFEKGKHDKSWEFLSEKDLNMTNMTNATPRSRLPKQPRDVPCNLQLTLQIMIKHRNGKSMERRHKWRLIAHKFI